MNYKDICNLSRNQILKSTQEEYSIRVCNKRMQYKYSFGVFNGGPM